jgi:hypothetical protein
VTDFSPFTLLQFNHASWDKTAMACTGTTTNSCAIQVFSSSGSFRCSLVIYTASSLSKSKLAHLSFIISATGISYCFSFNCTFQMLSIWSILNEITLSISQVDIVISCAYSHVISLEIAIHYYGSPESPSEICLFNEMLGNKLHKYSLVFLLLPILWQINPRLWTGRTEVGQLSCLWLLSSVMTKSKSFPQLKVSPLS